LLEGLADGHGLAHGFHRGGQQGVGPGEFFKGEARDFGDHVIERRFETGRGLSRDVIAQLVQRVADGQFGGDPGDGEAGGFGGEGGRAAHARIHFDDHQAAVRRVDRELDIRAAGLDADHPHDRDRRITHDLVFAVGQCHGRRHGDAVAGMDAHGVEIFDGTDDGDVVFTVAHDLHLEFFPAEHRLLDQDFADRTETDAVRADLFELLRVAGYAAATAAKGEGRPDDDGKGADFPLDLPRLRQRAGDTALRHRQVDGKHRVLEELPVLRPADDLGVRADHLDLVPREDAPVRQLNGEVQRRLPAQCRQQGVRALAPDDLVQDLDRERLNVGPVRKLRVGHDGCGVAVDQHHLVSLLAQCFAGLRAGIIKFAGLADDDRACPDDHDL